jgi:energy-coupling factor transporter ATP-binding protein EcfA2
MAFVILTGASGSGKTTIAEAVAARYGEQVEVYHFDSIGVPPPEEMIANYGSGEAWQRAMTYEWMARVAATPLMGRRILLEGQTRLSFVIEATTAVGISDYVLILADCDDATRTKRLLSDRRQRNLATPTMMNWAKYLRGEARQTHCTILNTAHLSLEHCVQRVWNHLGQ